MPLVETEGVVLQQRLFSETSKILTVFTEESGRIALLFKGGRRGIKKFPGGLESLNRIELQYYHRDGRELQNFKSFDLIDSYPNMRSDLACTYTALSAAETVLRATAVEDSNPELYQDLTKLLSVLNNHKKRLWVFRWKGLTDFCRSLGFGMELKSCPRCGNQENMIGFDLAVGGFVCNAHKISESQIIPVSGEVWGVLRFLNSCPYEVANRIAVSPAVGRQIEALFLQYFKYHVPGLKKFESWKKLPEIYWGEEEV